jgi:isoleucyl-tRNA synthetase
MPRDARVSQKIATEIQGKNILDKWILARLNQLISEVTENMEKYDLPRAVRPISEFISDLSTWYIRRSRDRFKSPSASSGQSDKQAALDTTAYVLIEISKVMAPFTPFLSEQLWQKVTGLEFSDPDRSVHLERWPESHNVERITHNVIEEMQAVRSIVELALAKRDEAGIKVRQPLQELRISNFEFRIEYLQLLKDELNVKNITSTKGKGEVSVDLDTEMTAELIEEGLAREIVRTVNAMRKESGLTIKDNVRIYYSADDEDTRISIKKISPMIIKNTLAVSMEYGKNENQILEKKAISNGKEIRLWFEK